MPHDAAPPNTVEFLSKESFGTLKKCSCYQEFLLLRFKVNLLPVRGNQNEELYCFCYTGVSLHFSFEKSLFPKYVAISFSWRKFVTCFGHLFCISNFPYIELYQNHKVFYISRFYCSRCTGRPLTRVKLNLIQHSQMASHNFFNVKPHKIIFAHVYIERMKLRIL